MIIDFHTHIFPETIRKNRADYFNLEPAFKLLYGSPKSKMVGAEEIVRAMDEAGVSKSVVFGFPWRKARSFKMHNDYVLSATRRFPDRLIGFGCFDVLHPKAAEEAERCLENGLVGIGELAFYESGIDDVCLDRLTPVMAICRTRNLPVMIHTNEPVGHQYPGKTPITLAQIDKLVETFPDNIIVLAHWGGGLFFFSLLKKEMKKRLTNVYFDTAASPFLYTPQIYRVALELIGQDKILLGSDFPLLGPSRYLSEMEKAGLTSAELASICHHNARRLLKLDSS